MGNKYVQYGCGLSAPQGWKNFDASPTLMIQRAPVIGYLLRKNLNVSFPANVLYGDIIKGLPVASESCDGVYCSHTLEHLALADCRTALRNTLKILKKNGIFRCVVPDLEHAARQYLANLDQKKETASIELMEATLLGQHKRPRGVKNFVTTFLGNDRHLWMWDSHSLSEEFRAAGFSRVRTCTFNDSNDAMFAQVEDAQRFTNAVAIEAIR